MLETERLQLRLPMLGDVDDLLALIGDPEVMRWLGGAEAGDRAATEAAVARWLRHWDENDIGHFCVVLDGRVIGRAGFLVWDGSVWETSSYRSAGAQAVTELGWAIAQPFWGHGYATEAARAARDWASERGIEPLVSLISPDNARSRRVAEKLGAVPTETVAVAGSSAVVWQHILRRRHTHERGVSPRALRHGQGPAR